MRHPTRLAILLFALTMSPLARHAAAQLREMPEAMVEALVRDLSDLDAETRRLAALRLKNLPGTGYAALERVAKREELAPEAKPVVDKALPIVRARSRRVKALYDNWQENLRTGLDAYDKFGKKNPAWDDTVRQAITLFTKPDPELAPGETHVALIGMFKKAIDAGCDDPFVAYLYARSLRLHGNGDPQEAQRLLFESARVLEQSSYPPDRKLYAAVRYLLDARQPDRLMLDICRKHLEATFAERNRPNDHYREVADLVFQAFQLEGDRKMAFDAVFPIYQKARPANDPNPAGFKGSFYVDYAWDARGGGWAGSVTDEGWKLFAERLQAADQELTRSWELDPADPRAATRMIAVCLGQDSDRDREHMERWFRRAMEADPDNLQACRDKLYYLYPRWHGSHREMISFARECLATENWFGRIPFLVEDAHIAVSREMSDPKRYLARDAVGGDIKRAYDGFLDLYPDSNWHQTWRVRWACRCGKWQDADKLFQALGDKADVRAFRGQAYFDYYRRKAAKKATEPPEVRQPRLGGPDDDPDAEEMDQVEIEGPIPQ